MGEDNVASVCPVGRVWHYLRDHNAGIELYMSDGSHPSIAGTYAAACAFNTMFFGHNPDSISYNFRSRKAFISNVYTQQGEGYMKSMDGKRDSTGTMYVKKAFYSTCDAEHPHFYLNMTRAKMRPGKDVVFGPTYLVVEDVPLPLAIPYGFFPFKDKYSSGFIMPSYGDETTGAIHLQKTL